jgi:hypothetical protein
MSRLTGVTKKDDRSIFIFTKEQSFYAQFRKLLLEAGFESWQIPEWCNPDDDPSLDVEGLQDHYLYGDSELLTVDLVLGKERIFLIVRGKDLARFNELVPKHFSFTSA